MIVGTGIDIIEVARVADRVKNTAFKRKVFSASECDYCESKSQAAHQARGVDVLEKSAEIKSVDPRAQARRDPMF